MSADAQIAECSYTNSKLFSPHRSVLSDEDTVFNIFIGKINIERLNKFELCKFNIFNFSSLQGWASVLF